MEQIVVNTAKAADLAQQLAALLEGTDRETRRRAIAAAMALLGEAAPGPIARDAEGVGGPTHEDLGAFFDREDVTKPADNAYLCAAYHYAQYGPVSFSLDEVRDIAAEAGVVIPDRVDMTLKQAARGRKKLFQVVGKDAYKPTATAGVVFKERWGIVPGRNEKRREAP